MDFMRDRENSQDPEMVYLIVVPKYLFHITFPKN